MAGTKLSDKEAAFLAAAKRDLTKSKADAATSNVPPAGVSEKSLTSNGVTSRAERTTHGTPSRAADTVAVAKPPPSVRVVPIAAPAQPAKMDAATRMAMLLAAERETLEKRKKRAKHIYIGICCAIMVPSFLYIVVQMTRLLGN